jgi:hypothetical protein
MSDDNIKINLKQIITMGTAFVWLKTVPSSSLLFHEGWGIASLAQLLLPSEEICCMELVNKFKVDMHVNSFKN